MAKKKRTKIEDFLEEEPRLWGITYGDVREDEDLFASGPNSNITIIPPEHMEFHPIQKPAHYVQDRQYETIDVLLDWFSADPLLWQVGKYISRTGRKGDAIEDLEKAKWYLEKKIQLLKEQGEK